MEQRNKVIGHALFTRMVGQELLTDVEDTQWTNHLKSVIKYYNIYQKEKNKRKESRVEGAPYLPKDTILLSIGQPVRVMLDKPVDTFGRKLMGNFRATDVRWSTITATSTSTVRKTMPKLENNIFQAWALFFL